MPVLESPFAQLRLIRQPEQQNEPLQAFDAADEYLLNHLAEQALPANSRVLVLNDSFGALAVSLVGTLQVTSSSDSFLAMQALEKNLVRNGKPFAEGDIFKQPELAHTLRLLADKGFDGFYKGETAKKLIAGVKQAGGHWTPEELAGYRVKQRTPITFDYKGWKIVTAPPASSGGIALACGSSSPYPRCLAGCALCLRHRRPCHW